MHLHSGPAAESEKKNSLGDDCQEKLVSQKRDRTACHLSRDVAVNCLRNFRKLSSDLFLTPFSSVAHTLADNILSGLGCQ